VSFENFRYSLSRPQQIAKYINRLLQALAKLNLDNTQKMELLWERLFSIIKELRQALFPGQVFLEFSQIIRNVPNIKLIVDRNLEYFLTIPWEILNWDSENLEPLWGEETLFHRTSLSMDTGAGTGRSFQKTGVHKWVGMVAYEQMPRIGEVKDMLLELAENKPHYLSYDVYPVNGGYGGKLIDNM